MPPATIKFLSVEDVLLIHQDTMEHEGGGRGVRELALLTSAVMMPQQCFAGEYLHPDLAAMAGAYLFHLCRNHRFIDGNKRASAMAMLVFLDVNGCTVLPRQEDLEKTTFAVAAGELTKEQVTNWLRSVMPG